MLNAVWMAVITAAAFWVAGVCVAVFLMLRTARLVSQATTAVSVLRERQEQLIERASTTIDRASEQLVRTDAITASMDEVTANMAELSGRVAALAPLGRMIAASAGSPLARVASLAYGVNRALWMRRGAGNGSGPARGAPPAAARMVARGAQAGRRRALTSQRDGTAP
jgi:hypothetical protein